ncbi:MAG: hypothetical protein JRH20_32065, partial [Deltaproteobacteria bacterium]|nr:hypothetical protein [Deltaproteobacteria bacterium]
MSLLTCTGPTLRRSRLAVVVVVVVLAAQAFAVYQAIQLLSSPTSGLIGVWHLGKRGYVVQPATAQAAAAMEQIPGPLLLRTVDGRPVEKLARVFVPAYQELAFISVSPVGRSHRYTFQDSEGKETPITLRTGPRDLGVSLGSLVGPLAAHGVGLLYLLMGIWVWWRRPRDPAANGLLYLCVAAAANMTLTLYRPGWELAAALDGSMLPLWASAALH